MTPDLANQFLNIMQARGLQLIANEQLLADGEIHRCDVIDKKPGNQDGSYLLRLDGDFAFGWVNNWTDERGVESYLAGREALTPAEQEEFDRTVKAARDEYAKELVKARHAARVKAKWMWAEAKTASPSHPYCQRKKIKPEDLRMMRFDDGDTLLVPVYDERGKLVNLQFIHADGSKYGLSGGRMQGCHYWLVKPDAEDDTICICEGWATGESVYQATGCPVIIAFNDRNLVPVAEWVRQRYPDHHILIAADDDWKTKGNPGLAFATEAARIIDGLVAVPRFDEARGDKDTDFNDLFVASGSKAVRQAIADAVEADVFDGNSEMSVDEKYAARIAKLATLVSRAYDAEREAIKKEFKHVRLSTIDKDVEQHRKQQHKTEQQATPPPPDINELAASAADIIACEDVLELSAEECSTVIAGEETLTKLLCLSGTSRLFPKAMHVAVKGTSAGGKSEVRKRVLEFFPPEAVFTFTALSERALIYEQRDFQHLILSMGEAFNRQEADFQDYILRELLSEGVMRYPVVQKQPDGTMQTVTIEKNGPVAFMITTTRNKLHEENETRMLSIEIDDSAEQTRKVIEKVAEEEGLNRDIVNKAITPWRDFQRWLAAGECQVYVPFSRELAQLIRETKSVPLRRDFGQLLRGIKAHALLHREHRRRTKRGSIMATIEEDYAAIRVLMADLLATASEIKTRKAIQQTVEVVTELLDELRCADDDPPYSSPRARDTASADGISVREIAARLRLDISAAYRRLQAAEMAGLVINQETRPRRPGRYTVTGDRQDAGYMLPKVKELRETYDKARRMRATA